MHKSSLYIAMVVGFGVFTVLSIDILRDLYGESALLVIYAILAILIATAVYSFTERITELGTTDSDDESTDDQSKDSDDEEDTVVEKEMENLKED